MVRYLASLLETHEADVFKHAAYTNLVKCSMQDEQGLLRGATMSECFKRHLRREIDFFKPVALVAFGREVEQFLERAAREGLHDRPVFYLKHPSYPYRRDRLQGALDEVRKKIKALGSPAKEE
jgi:uracil-DNA glycosylase